MHENDWDKLFTSFRGVLEAEGKRLPSVSLIAEENQDPFTVLVATLLSLRTKDEVTLKASRKLFALADTPQKMMLLPAETIEKTIYPVLYYKTKARNLIAISKQILALYDGKVPNSSEELLKLPGVGIKTANLTLNLGFGIDAICVDCHVHQIANRMGWVSTKNAEQTETALQKVMPKRYWIPLNELLVLYGQNICTPIRPWCSKCPQRETCPKIGVKASR